jgi:hypothetical protein
MVSHWVKGPTSTSRDFNVSFNGGRQIVSPAACHAPERVLWGACRFAMKITALWDPVDVVRPRQAPPSYHITRICPGAPANGPERWRYNRLLMGR